MGKVKKDHEMPQRKIHNFGNNQHSHRSYITPLTFFDQSNASL